VKRDEEEENIKQDIDDLEDEFRKKVQQLNNEENDQERLIERLQKWGFRYIFICNLFLL